MKLFNWLRPEPPPAPEAEVRYVVDPHMGERQLQAIKKHVSTSRYQVGDSIESVAYRQGQLDLCDFIHKQILGGRL